MRPTAENNKNGLKGTMQRNRRGNDSGGSRYKEQTRGRKKKKREEREKGRKMRKEKGKKRITKKIS